MYIFDPLFGVSVFIGDDETGGPARQTALPQTDPPEMRGAVPMGVAASLVLLAATVWALLG